VCSGSRRREQAELVPLGVTHDCDPTTRELFPRPRVRSAKSDDTLDRGVDGVNEDVDVDADLADARFLDWLEVDEGSVRTPWL